MRLEVGKTWDGLPVDANQRAVVSVKVRGDDLLLEVDAPYFGDPRPAGAAGRTDRLWEYEVVELFLLGNNERYLEIEMGPHGHYLVLRLAGRRHVERRALLMHYEATIADRRWRGKARVPRACLPPGVSHGNAYASHGVGGRRRYLAAHPVPGDQPDFHRLECFGEISLLD